MNPALVITLLHTKRPKLYAILAFLSAVGLMFMRWAKHCQVSYPLHRQVLFCICCCGESCKMMLKIMFNLLNIFFPEMIQISWGFEGNSGIFFLISQQKHNL